MVIGCMERLARRIIGHSLMAVFKSMADLTFLGGGLMGKVVLVVDVSTNTLFWRTLFSER